MARGRISFLGLRTIQVTLVLGGMMGVLAGCSSSLRTTIVSGSEGQNMQVVQVELEPAVLEAVAAQPILEIIDPAVPVLNIPVEEPARAVMRRETGREIFTTPRTPAALPEMSSRVESLPSLVSPPSKPALLSPAVEIPAMAFEPELPASAVPPPSKPAMPSPAVEIPAMAFEPELPASAVPSSSKPAMQSPAVGIPVIPFEPELPALPTRRDNPVSPVEEAPVLTNAEIPSTPDVSVKKEPIQVAKVMSQEPEEVTMTTGTLEAALGDIYFDYDQSSIRGDAVQILKANVELLSAKLAESNIVIEGHCDERGTQSYNMVLGEARAKAVKTFLEDLGISGDTLQVVSYGKDKPFCREQTEECWQENRRGHFVIK